MATSEATLREDTGDTEVQGVCTRTGVCRTRPVVAVGPLIAQRTIAVIVEASVDKTKRRPSELSRTSRATCNVVGGGERGVISNLQSQSRERSHNHSSWADLVLDPKTTHGQRHKLYNANNPLFLFLHSIKVFFVKVDGGHSSRFVFKPHFWLLFPLHQNPSKNPQVLSRNIFSELRQNSCQLTLQSSRRSKILVWTF